MENNFRQWKEQNPDKTLDDFKKLVCISDEEIERQAMQNRKRPKKIKYWIGFAVILVVSIIAGNYGGRAIVNFFRSIKTSEEILTQEWVKQNYMGLSIETPVKLNAFNMSLSNEVKQAYDSLFSYISTTQDGFQVVLSTAKYKQEIDFNLQNGANGSINEVKMKQGVTDLHYEEEKVFYNNIPGIRQTGTCKINGIKIEFVNSLYAQAPYYWQFFVGYAVNNEVGRIAAGRILESIDITPPEPKSME